MWQLWHQRAKFDMSRADPVPAQIYVRCNFCTQPFSLGRIVPRRVGVSGVSGPSGSSSLSKPGGVTTTSSGLTSKQSTQKQRVSDDLLVVVC
jgi:hypothetical protein